MILACPLSASPVPFMVQANRTPGLRLSRCTLRGSRFLNYMFQTLGAADGW